MDMGIVMCIDMYVRMCVDILAQELGVLEPEELDNVCNQASWPAGYAVEVILYNNEYDTKN